MMINNFLLIKSEDRNNECAILAAAFFVVLSCCICFLPISLRLQFDILVIVFLFVLYFLIKSKVNIYLVICQLIVFICLIFLVNTYSHGSWILGYGISNDPVNHAYQVIDIINSQGRSSGLYPQAFHLVSAYLVNVFNLDIGVSNVLLSIFFYSLLVYPVFSLFKLFLSEKDKLPGYMPYVISILSVFSYFTFTHLVYGFYTETSSIPFVLTFIYILISDIVYRKNSLDKIVLLGILVAEMYWYYLYFLFPLFVVYIFILIKRNSIINVINNKKVFIYLILFLPYLFYFVPILFSYKQFNSFSIDSYANLKGNLVGFNSLIQAYGFWPFVDYRFSVPGKKLIFLNILSVIFSMALVGVLFEKGKILAKNLFSFFVIICFFLFYLVFLYILKSPYLVGKNFSLLSIYLLIMLFVVLLRYIKFKLLAFILISLLIIGNLYSNYITLTNVPYFDRGIKEDINLIKDENLTQGIVYLGSVDWLPLYLVDYVKLAPNVHYQSDRYRKVLTGQEVYIFDLNQTKEIVGFSDNGYCISGDNKYFVVMSKTNCNSQKINLIYMLRMTNSLNHDYFLGLNVNPYVWSNDKVSYISVNFNPVDKEKSCTSILKNFSSNIFVGLKDFKQIGQSNGVTVFLRDGDKFFNKGIVIGSSVVEIKSSDLNNKQLCFDPNGDITYDWLLLRLN